MSMWEFSKISGPCLDPNNSRALVIRTPEKNEPPLIETALLRMGFLITAYGDDVFGSQGGLHTFREDGAVSSTNGSLNDRSLYDETVSAYVCIFLYTYTHVCMHVCIHICTCVYTYIEAATACTRP